MNREIEGDTDEEEGNMDIEGDLQIVEKVNEGEIWSNSGSVRLSHPNKEVGVVEPVILEEYNECDQQKGVVLEGEGQADDGDEALIVDLDQNVENLVVEDTMEVEQEVLGHVGENASVVQENVDVEIQVENIDVQVGKRQEEVNEEELNNDTIVIGSEALNEGIVEVIVTPPPDVQEEQNLCSPDEVVVPDSQKELV